MAEIGLQAKRGEKLGLGSRRVWVANWWESGAPLFHGGETIRVLGLGKLGFIDLGG